MKIVLATHNAGKAREIQALLDNLDVELILQSQFGIEEPEENGVSFIENALIKARHASEKSGLPALADDSGLSVQALHGAPGVYSSRYAGPGATDADRIAKVLSELSGVPDDQRQAEFHCAIVLVRFHDDPDPIICEGIWPGIILQEPRGSFGFGYDPIFYAPDVHCAAAELAPDFKNKISHRGRAIDCFLEKFTRSLV